MKKIFLYYFIFMGVVNSLGYSEILDENRCVDWSKAGYNGGVDQIPFISSQTYVYFNVKDYGAKGNGVDDDYQAFANAISAAKNYAKNNNTLAVVYVPEGEYLIKSKLLFQDCDGVVLKGDGYKKTKLYFEHSSGDCFEVVAYRRGTWVNAVSGYNKGSTQILVSDVSQFKVGDIAEIQQDNDPDIMYTNPEWNQSWAQYAVGQFFRIVGINDNTLIIDPPLNISFRQDLNPQVRRNNLVSNVGFEDFHVEIRKYIDCRTFYFKNAVNCWVRRVSSYMTSKVHVGVTTSLNIEIRECYFNDSYRHDDGGHGYGVELGLHVTNCLVENNIFKRLRHSMMVHIGANGNVFGYNYSIEPYQNQSPGWTPCDISIHGHYPFMNLFEGNIVQEIDYADYWGPSGPGNTMFRNRVESEGIEVMDHSNYQNIIANEIVPTSSVDIKFDNTIDTTTLIIHGNNIKGTIQYDPKISDRNFPASYYRKQKPKFYPQDMPWPSIGYNIQNGVIPAKIRYETGEYIPEESSGDGVTTYSLNVEIIPFGSGSVSLTPAGGVYVAGTTVTLTAQAAGGWVFSSWSGAISSTRNPVNIVMDENKSITANFVRSSYTLNVSINPQEAGFVILDPPGSIYPVGTEVTLIATVNSSDYIFSNWSGDLISNQNPATIIMDSDKSVTANFVLISSTQNFKETDTYIITVNNDQQNREVIFGEVQNIDGVFIYDTKGKLVLKVDNKLDENSVNNLSVGIYFYKIVYRDNKTKTGKIVIVR